SLKASQASPHPYPSPALRERGICSTSRLPFPTPAERVNLGTVIRSYDCAWARLQVISGSSLPSKSRFHDPFGPEGGPEGRCQAEAHPGWLHATRGAAYRAFRDRHRVRIGVRSNLGPRATARGVRSEGGKRELSVPGRQQRARALLG